MSLIGSVISHYKIIEVIGEGGMGMVYKAEDLNLKRIVAIKFLPPHLNHDPQARARFSQEAMAASELDHPNICTIYDIDHTADGQIFIVMAYYQGQTLDEKIKKKQLSITHTIHIVAQIAEGLTLAHQHGIVHRDIKPANILITDEGDAKILDFGLAKLAGQPSITKEHTSIGTVNYMSPEQAQGDSVDDRTDIWSLGILFYETLSGTFPFKGEYEQAVIYNIINQDPQPLSQLRSDVSAEIEGIIQRALAKSPADRYQTVLDMLQDLQSLEESETVLTAEVKHLRKSKTMIARMGLIGILTVVLIFIGVVFIPWQKFSDRVAKEKSITVLPFENLNKGQNDDYFSDGITEDITVQLSKIGDLKVISYQSSQAFKETQQNLLEIGRELNVSHILSGRVRRQNDMIRITTTLIKTQDGEQIWAERYDRQIKEVFSIQRDVAQRIASALQITLSSQEKAQIQMNYTDNLDAYDYYLKGRNYYNRFRMADNNTAITLFKKSLAVDPQFALALTGLADAMVQKTLRFAEESYWLDSAVVYCRQALTIEPDLAEAHKALGLIYYTRSWFKESLSENKKALKLNPNFFYAMHNLGWIYLNLGQLNKAYIWLEKARRLNPTFASTYLGMGTLSMNLGDFDQSEMWLQEAFDIHPDFRPNPLIASMMLHLMQNQLDSARRLGEKLLSLIPSDESAILACADVALISGNPSKASELYQRAVEINPEVWHPFTGINITTSLGFILWKTEQFEQAEELFAYSLRMDEQTLEQGSQWWGVQYDMAAVHAIKGDSVKCLEFLNQAVQNGFRLVDWLIVDPLFENVRESIEFQDIIANLEHEVLIAKSMMD